MLRGIGELGQVGPLGHAKALVLHLSEAGIIGALRAEECTVGLKFPCFQ